MYTVILFYKYTDISDPAALLLSQRELCEALGLKGRIILSKEGINGTLEGETQNIEKYCENLLTIPGFSDIDIKRSEGTGNAFPKLKINVRDEIVSSKLHETVNPAVDTGNHLDVDLLHKWYEEDEDFVIVDMRNDYEYVSGHFEKSINPQFRDFRDLAEKVDSLEIPKDKKVVTVCTGGVRCEKASAFLKQKGYKDVYQLKNGMHTYLEKYPKGHFKGALYVFDGRVTVRFDKDGEVVGRCEFCSSPTELYANDDTAGRSRHILCCDNCLTLKQEQSLAIRR